MWCFEISVFQCFGLLLGCVTGLFYTCELLFWEQFWEPQNEGAGWQQPLVLAAVLTAGMSSLGQAWVEGWISTQGDHSTFHLPRSLHTSFLCLLQLRSAEGGKALWAGLCTSWGRARSHLCSFLSSTVATSSSRMSLLSGSKLLHGLALPCSAPGAAPLPGWVRGQSFSVHAVPLQGAQLFHEWLLSYVHLCFWRPHTSAVLGYKQGSCFIYVSLTLPFFFLVWVFLGFFFSKRFLSIAGEIFF